MSLATLENDVRTDLTAGLDYLDGLVGRLKTAAPGIIATADAVGGSTVAALVDAVAGRILPAGLEPILASIVRDFVDKYAVAAPAQPQQQPAQAPAQ